MYLVKYVKTKFGTRMNTFFRVNEGEKDILYYGLKFCCAFGPFILTVLLALNQKGKVNRV